MLLLYYTSTQLSVMYYRKRAVYLNDVYWRIDTTPDKAEYIHQNKETDENIYQTLTEEQWNKIHRYEISTVYLIMPITRFADVNTCIPLGEELTYNVVLNAIHDFYHTPLTKEQVEKIQGFPNDVFGNNNIAIENNNK